MKNLSYTESKISNKEAHTDYVRALLNFRGFLLYPDGAVYEQGYREDMKKTIETVKQFNATTTVQVTIIEGAIKNCNICPRGHAVNLARLVKVAIERS